MVRSAMNKGESRRGRGGDPRRHQLRGDEVRRERNLHRRVSKKEEVALGPSAPSVWSFCPADSCYIRLTHLMSQAVSRGLQFLHNRRVPPTAHRHHRHAPPTPQRRRGGPSTSRLPRPRAMPHPPDPPTIRNRAKSSIFPASPPSSDQNARFSAIPFLPV